MPPAYAISTLKTVGAHPEVVFEMADHRFNGGSASHLSADGFGGGRGRLMVSRVREIAVDDAAEPRLPGRCRPLI